MGAIFKSLFTKVKPTPERFSQNLDKRVNFKSKSKLSPFLTLAPRLSLFLKLTLGVYHKEYPIFIATSFMYTYIVGLDRNNLFPKKKTEDLFS